MPKKATNSKDAAPEAMPLEEADFPIVLGVPHSTQTDVPSEPEGRVEPHVVPQSALTEAATTSQSVVIARLKTPRGATVAKLMEITGWQKHTVRGFLSAVVRKKLNLPLISETGKDGNRRYRIAKAGEGNCA